MTVAIPACERKPDNDLDNCRLAPLSTVDKMVETRGDLRINTGAAKNQHSICREKPCLTHPQESSKTAINLWENKKKFG